MSRAAITHFGGYIINALGALLGVVALSYWVPPHIYGQLALYIAIATAFQYIVRESLGQALLRFSVQIIDNKYYAKKLFTQALPLLSVCLLSIIAALFYWLPDASFSQQLLGILLVVLLALFTLGETLLSSLLNRTACAIHVNLGQWLRFLFAVVFFIIHPSLNALLAGFCLGLGTALVFDYYQWQKLPQHAVLSPPTEQFFHGLAPIIIGLSLWATNFFDRLALEYFYNEAFLGAYQVLLQVAYMPIFTIIKASSGFLFPLLFHENKTPNKTYLLGFLAVFISAGLVLFGIHQWLFSWLVGPSYRQYSYLLPWVYFAALIHGIVYLLQANFYQGKKMRQLLYLRVSTAIIAIALIIGLTPIWQIKGIVLANSLAAVISLALSLLLQQHNNKHAKQTL